MSMDNRDPEGVESSRKKAESGTDLSPWARYWARHKRVPQDSHLVSFGDKVTYTFAMGNDVASIHYDQHRGEVFYKGHKVETSRLDAWMIDLLKHFKTILAESEYAEKFLKGYSELLNKKLHMPPKGE